MKFEPNADMIEAAKAVFFTRANVEMVRPVVTKYQQDIIDYMRPLVAQKYRDRMGDKEIKDPKHSYLMDDQDAKYYYRRCNEEAKKAGYNVQPGYCPFLVAEEAQRKAERLLISAIAPAVGMDRESERRVYYTLDGYQKFVDLSLRLLAPFVGDSRQILAGYGIKGAA